MILNRHIQEWSQKVPWTTTDMVEQDLVLHRCLFELYQDPELSELA